MTTLLSYAIVLALLALFGVAILRLHCGRRARGVIFGLRVIAVVSLLLLIIKPVIRYQQIHRSNPRIAVLVDNSLSSRLFPVDSLVNLLQKSPLNPRIDLFTFADSLKKVRRSDEISYAVNQTIFPDLSSKKLAPYDQLLVLSDGNFDSSGIDTPIEGRAFFALSLMKNRSLPFVTITAPSEVTVERELPETLSLAVNGFSGHTTDSLILTTRINDQIISVDHIGILRGEFSKGIKLLIPPQKKSRRLLSVVAITATDTAATHIVVKTVTHRTAVAFLGAFSLDRRALSIALADEPFTVTENSPEAAIISGPVHLENLPPRIPLLYIAGRAPFAVDSFAGVRLAPSVGAPFTLPPIHLALPRSANLLPVLTLFSPGGEAVPILLTGRSGDHPVMILTTEFWQWRLAAGEDQTAALITRQIIEAATTFLSEGGGGSPLVRPLECEPNRRDSLRLTIDNPPAESALFGMILQDAQGKKLSELSRNAHQPITLSPLAAGRYQIVTSHANELDTTGFFVSPCAREKRVTSQNRAVLSSFVRFISLRELDSITALPPVTTVIPSTFAPGDSWILLLILLATLCGEWGYRKYLFRE